MTADTAPDLSADQNGPALTRARAALLRELAAPLLAALYEVQGSMGQTGEALVEQNLKLFDKLIDNSTAIAGQIGTGMGAGMGADSEPVRWGVAAGVAQCVAAHYRATSRPLPPAEAEGMLNAFNSLERRFPGLMPVGPEYGAMGLGLFRAKLLEAMAPLVHAVATYSFNRPEHALLAEIAERILQAAETVTRALASPGGSAEDWRTLVWSVVKSSAELYHQCHWDEADRLLYMDPEERAAYFAENGQDIPMEKVWQAFDQRLGMLTTLMAYLELTPGMTGEKDKT